MIEALEIALTSKQSHLVEAYSETRGNAAEAELTVCNCSRQASARVMAQRNLHHTSMRAYLDLLLLKSDVPRKLVDALMRQLDAEKRVVVNGQLRPVADNPARGRAMDFALQLVEWADLD